MTSIQTVACDFAAAGLGFSLSGFFAEQHAFGCVPCPSASSTSVAGGSTSCS
jgi:hypothetical protein